MILGADSPEAARLAALARCAGRDVRARRRTRTGARPRSRARGGTCRFDVTLPRRALRPLRGAAARRAQRRATRWRRWPSATRPACRPTAMRRGAGRVPGRAAAARAARRGARRLGLRRLRASSDGDPRDARAVRCRRTRTGAIWAVFEPRSATSCRRVFQDDFARAFVESGADEIDPRAGVSIDAARGRAAVGRRARPRRDAGRPPRALHCPTSTHIVATIAAEARDGDLVVIMSNGGFDGIHDKLLAALAA